MCNLHNNFLMKRILYLFITFLIVFGNESCFAQKKDSTDYIKKANPIVPTPTFDSLTLSKAYEGDEESQYTIGMNWLDALLESEIKTSEPDYGKEALAWFEKAASKGHKNANIEAGVIFFNRYTNDFSNEGYKEKALSYLLKGGAEGNPILLMYLTVLVSTGESFNFDQALKWCNKAIKMGLPINKEDLPKSRQMKYATLGCAYWVKATLLKATADDESLAYSDSFENLVLAEKNGYNTAGVFIGECYFLGLGVDRDRQKAIEIWNSLKKLSVPDSLAIRSEISEMESTYFIDPDILTKANSGDAESQYLIGIQWQNNLIGKGLVGFYFDNDNALEWFEKAAAQGHKEALIEAGVIYSHRYFKSIGNYMNNITNNTHNKWYKEQAISYFIQAGAEEDPILMMDLAGLVSDVVGTEDKSGIRQALFLCKKAISLGLPLDENNMSFSRQYGFTTLGKAYYYYALLWSDMHEYSKYYENLVLAKENGYDEALVNIGECYFLGWGVEQDRKKAIEIWDSLQDNYKSEVEEMRRKYLKTKESKNNHTNNKDEESVLREWLDNNK